MVALVVNVAMQRIS